MAPRQGWQGGGGRELDQGGQAEDGAEGGRAFPGHRHPDQRRHEEEPHHVEVCAPRRLHNHERRPQVPDQHFGRVPTGAGGDPLQERCASEVEAQPHQLGRQDGSAGHVHQSEERLGQRRVDGRYVGMVDLSVPLGPDRREGFVVGWMGVGIDAFQEDVTVPQVPVDVVGEFGGEGKEGNTGDDADSPQEQQGRGGTSADAKPRRHVAEECGSGQQKAGQRQRDPVQPAKGAESSDFEDAEQEDEYDGRGCRSSRTRRLPVVTGDVQCRFEIRRAGVLLSSPGEG